MDRNTGKRCVQEGKHRNSMSEHGTGTGTRIGTGTGTGTKIEMVILRSVLVIPEFERGTKFRESRESVRSCDSSASRADEFRGGTSAVGVTVDVTGSELAKVCQQSHVSVTGHNSTPQLASGKVPYVFSTSQSYTEDNHCMKCHPCRVQVKLSMGMYPQVSHVLIS